MLSWVVMVLGVWTVLHFLYADSHSIFYNAGCPILVFAFLVSFFVKVALLILDRGRREDRGDLT